MPSCPNINTCRLINVAMDFVGTSDVKTYKRIYCTTSRFSGCKRYQFKQKAGFCPDFVLPDTTESDDDIMERFDQGNDD